MDLPPILFADESMLVLDKPPGLPVAPASARGGETSLIGLLKTRYDAEVKPVHRIDPEVGGPVVFARDKPALDFLSGQFQSKTAEAVWAALAVALPVSEVAHPTRAVRDEQGIPPDTFVLDWPILADASQPHLWRIGRRQDGRSATTVVRSAEHFGRFVLLECVAPPAPLHQVRLHLATAGLPLLNDTLYGAPGVELRLSALKRGYKGRAHERPLIRDLALHLIHLTVKHPVSRESMTFASDLPKDFQLALKNLRKFSGKR